MDGLLKFTDWQTFPQLETLALCAFTSRDYPIDTIDLDVSGAQTLRRLQIENWSPKSIRAAAGCRVHAVWQPPANIKVAKKMTVHSWLQSPCWRAPGTNLAALHIEHLIRHDFIQLSAILERQHLLETLRITLADAGSPDSLLNMLFPYFKGMKTLLKVDISTVAACFLNVHDMLCLCKTLVLDVKGPVLVTFSEKLYSGVLEGYSASAVEVKPLFTQEQPARAKSCVSRYKNLDAAKKGERIVWDLPFGLYPLETKSF